VKLPAAFEALEVDDRTAFARPKARDWIENALQEQVTLWLAVRRRGPAFTLQGRAPIMVSEAPGGVGHWVVRRYWRGGGMRFLADRHLRVGTRRPVIEAMASERLRSAGVPTPRVMGAAVYPAGIFYRADVVTEYVPDAVDLTALLLAPGGPWHSEPELRLRGLVEVGRTVGRLARAGGSHPDLNTRNLLIRLEDSDPAVTVIDLDRCRVEDAVMPIGPMLQRLQRSVRKESEALGAPFPTEAWSLLVSGAEESGP